MKPFQLKYSILKSSPSLAHPQSVHCDTDDAYSLRGDTVFPFSVLIGLEEYSFLDIKLESHDKAGRVLINRGEALFVRGDIPHRGCENMATHTHYRIHAYVQKKKTVKKSKRKGRNTDYEVEKNTVIVDETFPDPPVWCFGEQRWSNELTIGK